MFTNWYSDPELTQEYDFNEIVPGSLTLYAAYKDNPEAMYQVRYYVEYQINDGPEGTVGKGEWGYKFVGSETRKGATRRKAVFDPEFIFEQPYNYLRTPYEIDMDKTGGTTVQSDGSTVFNVYYRCKSYSLAINVPKVDGTVERLTFDGVKYGSSLKNFWAMVFAIRPEKELFDGKHRMEYSVGQGTGFIYSQYGSGDFDGKMPAQNMDLRWGAVPDNNSYYNVYFETLNGQAPDGKEVVKNISLRREGDEHTYYLFESDSFWSLGNGAVDFPLNNYPGFTPAPQFSDGHYRVYKNGECIIWFRYHADWGKVNQLVDENGKGISYWGKDMPLNIYFLRNSYTLTFHTDGGPQVKDSSVLFEDDLRKYIPSNYKENVTEKTEGNMQFVFGGWYSDQKLTKPFDFNGKMPSNNLDIYAKWIQKTYTVTFDTGEANVKIDPETDVAYGTTVHLPQDPVYKEHIFLGWTLNGRPFRADSKVVGETRLKAEWRSYRAFGVSYDLNGGEGETPTDGKLYYENSHVVVASSAGLKAPEDKVFVGWKSSVDGKIYYPNSLAVMGFVSLPVMPVNGATAAAPIGLTLTAQWDDIEKTTHLTYDLNFDRYGITGVSVSEQSVNALRNNSVVTLAGISSLSAIPEGWVFDGWYLDAACIDGPYTDVIVDTKDDRTGNRVYAKWIRSNHEDTPSTLEQKPQSTALNPLAPKPAASGSISGKRFIPRTGAEN